MIEDILVLGFQRNDEKMYPHMRHFLDELSQYYNVSYFHFKERGYVFECIYTKLFFYICFNFISSIFYTVYNIFFLLKKRSTEYKCILCVDYFSYMICSHILHTRNVILWSHDIIGPDHKFNSITLFRYINNGFLKTLFRLKRIIIQSEERARLLLRNDQIDLDLFDIFYMPVFLRDVPSLSMRSSCPSRPRLMQVGGIGAYHYSDELLKHYQENSSFYRLCFHGRIFGEISDQLTTCKEQPLVSSRMIPPEQTHQIIDHCDIGFVGYRECDTNFHFIAMASGQVTEFLRLGKPLIVMGKNNLDQFVQEHGVGLCIKDMMELTAAIEKIRSNYSWYSVKSRACYEEYFMPSKYIPQFLNWI